MFVRVLDDLGRVVIPKELRKKMGICPGDGIAIYADGGKIILQKNVFVCFACDSPNEVEKYKKGYFCQECRDKLSATAS